MNDDETPSADSAGAEPTAPVRESETVVSTIVADRMCSGCGYNLVGQNVLREPHYRMLVTRCPECGAYASVQEFPLLGIWSRRLGFFVAAIVIVLMVLALPATSASLWGMSESARQLRQSAVADRIWKEFHNVREEDPDATWNKLQTDFAQWFETFPQSERVRLARPWSPLSPPEAATLLLTTLFTIGFGLIWAALLSGRGAVARLIWWMLITALLSLFITTAILQVIRDSGLTATGRGFVSHRSMADAIVAPRILPAAAAFHCLILLAIILAGDRITPLLIRILLPLRMQRLFTRTTRTVRAP